MTAPVIPAAAHAALLPHDLSPWGMFLGADWIVQLVMVGLAIASVLTWTVLVAKSWELARIGRRLRDAREVLLQSRTLAEVADSPVLAGHIGEHLVAAAEAELRLSADTTEKQGIKERVLSRLDRLDAAYARHLRRGTGLLATIGSTAPFVGLFGTVWGIMNSFVGIARTQTTTLAVVAPGIAEALLATAIGLVAAIPAVVIYNHFTRAIAGCRAQTGDLAAAVLQLVSRDLDRHGTERRPHLTSVGAK
jgi:biopolymer transport protein ExbB